MQLSKEELKNFSHSMSLNVEVFEFILNHLPLGGTILELGSGNTTDIIRKYYKVISIEHDSKWLMPSEGDHKSYHCPIDGDWYHMEMIKSLLKNEDYDLVLVDGPLGYEGNKSGSNRTGMIRAFEYFKKDIIYIFDDTNRLPEKELSNQWAEKSGKHMETFNCGKFKKFTVLFP